MASSVSIVLQYALCRACFWLQTYPTHWPDRSRHQIEKPKSALYSAQHFDVRNAPRSYLLLMHVHRLESQDGSKCITKVLYCLLLLRCLRILQRHVLVTRFVVSKGLGQVHQCGTCGQSVVHPRRKRNLILPFAPFLCLPITTEKLPNCLQCISSI
jgi:hypothetical protein